MIERTALGEAPFLLEEQMVEDLRKQLDDIIEEQKIKRRRAAAFKEIARLRQKIIDHGEKPCR